MSKESKLKLSLQPKVDPVLAKYARNLFDGLMAPERGRITSFTGYHPSHFNGLALRTHYDAEFVARFQDTFVTPTTETAANFGIELYRAVQHWDIHNTISHLRYNPGNTPGSREDSFRRVFEHPLTEEAQKILVGVDADYNFLFGGNAITIAATQIPSEVLEARRMMGQVAGDVGMMNVDMSNILHLTIARIKGFDASSDIRGFHFALLDTHGVVRNNRFPGQVVRADVMTNERMYSLYEQGLHSAAS